MMLHLLHGRLDVTIYEADKLQTHPCNFNLCSKGKSRRLGKKILAHLKSCLVCQCQPEVIGMGLYVTIGLFKVRVGQTRMVKDQPSNPKWNETFHIYSAYEISNIVFTVKQVDSVGTTLIGKAYIPVGLVIKNNIVDTWAQILDKHLNPIPGDSKIHVKIQYFDVKNDINWSQGIKSPQIQGVPHTFFNKKSGCKVTLYQDAHVPDGPRIPLSGGKYFQSGRCWEDIYKAILDAKHFIYIIGWSVYTEITLVRDPKSGGSRITLGELLKKKANEGVSVLVLIWDDRNSAIGLVKAGSNHNQETEQYFRNTNVHCVLCPRNPDNGKSKVQGFKVSTMFTHHQKTIVVDSQVVGAGGPWQKRTIVSFLGGIDLCDGRYDTQEHPLFSTLNTIHHGDFHQPNFPGASIKKGGPREPWHDIHCKLEGPVAWDVLYNFQQRWEKQVGKEFLLVPSSKLDEILIPQSIVATTDENETWDVQVFRSIDGTAASSFPQDPEEAAEKGLVSGKDNIIDRSIQDAYIDAIQCAKDFIYIENQYFLGSSYGWHISDIEVEDIGALHLIPKELSLKIVSKIEAGQRFAVYIVIPMWPEGVPESASVQAILDWQRRTMQMMYADIAKAIQNMRIKAHPRDYLTFFCLGKREPEVEGEYTPPEIPELDSDLRRAQNARRFMIHVHSKMMIVDDEYIIIGSANINQRSMDGGRDTEIAMGAFQPHHLVSRGPQRPRGHIYGFRRALWYEHLGDPHDEVFDEPESKECVNFVNDLAERNWKLYSNDTFDKNAQLHHLLRYPIEVANDGSITTLPGFEFFPDTKARVLGTKTDYLPPILTT